MPWNGGSTLLNYISTIKFKGLTGPVSFAESKRTNFKLDLLKLKDDKMTKVGEWTPLTGLNISDKYAFLQGKPPNITLRVMTRIEEPFVMFKKQKDEMPLTGNDRFEGFCVDLLEQISDQVGFKYIIELVPDNNYGALNLTSGEWNGLVKGKFTLFENYSKCRIFLILAFSPKFNLLNLTCLVTLFDHKLQIFKNSPK